MRTFACLFAFIVAIIALAPTGCRRDDPAVERAPPSPRGDATRGMDLLVQYQCGRCHDFGLLDPVPRNKHCVNCHKDILSGDSPAPEEVLPRWKERVHGLASLPSMPLSNTHYRRAWVERFLLDPYDVRPHLDPMMPRLPLTPDQARDIATLFSPLDEGPISWAGADPARGRALLEKKGCGACHLFTGVPALLDGPPAHAADQAPVPAVALAPDLRTTRDRLRVDGLVAWLLDPAAVKPGTPMPSANLSPAEARDIAMYIVTAELAPPAAEPIPERLPILSRKVTYDEVSRRVLRRTCWHCHADPDYGIGDGGPGNTGGFGFHPRGLNLATYEGVSSGYLDDAGERQSIFAPTDDGTPRLVRALLARREELAGRSVPEIRGMPLGLPAVSKEDIQLVETWIAQGRPE